jgi:hypothetical protein
MQQNFAFCILVMVGIKRRGNLNQKDRPSGLFDRNNTKRYQLGLPDIATILGWTRYLEILFVIANSSLINYLIDLNSFLFLKPNAIPDLGTRLGLYIVLIRYK